MFFDSQIVHSNTVLSQPAGVGFSTAAKPANYPVTVAAAAQDFNLFLHVFYKSIFPVLSGLPLHFAGESFGGRYIPGFSKYMIERQKAKAEDAVLVKLESIILVNALIDPSQTYLGQIDHFCSDQKGNGYGSSFNLTACTAMRRAAPDCERQGQVCRDTFTIANCKKARIGCGDGVGKWFGQDVGPGGRNPYDG